MSRSRYRAHPLVVRKVAVRAVEDVTPRMRRVVVGGPQLGAFERDGMKFPAFAAPGFDDHVKLIFAPGGEIADALPRQLDNGIDWLPCEHRETRDYTPHHHDPHAREMALDFVVHTEDGPAGPAEQWVRSVTPGQDLWFVGPKSSTVITDDIDEMVLIGDETAIPAITRFFADRPVDVPARALVAVADEDAVGHIEIGEHDRIDWVVAAPGDRDALLAAARALEPAGEKPYVWAAAESRALLGVRGLATREWLVPKSRINITGYWHIRTQPPGDGAAGSPDGGPSTVEKDAATTTFTPITSPVPWLAVRAAIRSGLLDALSAGPRQRGDLELVANGVGADPLLDVLVDCGVIVIDGESVGLGPIGEIYVEDDHAREQFDGLYAEQILALAQLSDALGTDRPAWAHRSGATLRSQVATVQADYGELVAEAEGLVFLMPALVRAARWSQYGLITLNGPASLVVADGLRSGGVDVALRVVEESVPLSALRGQNPPVGVDFTEDWDGADAVILANACEHRTDAEVRAHLARLHEVTSTVFVVESTAVDALNAHATELALVHLGTVGVAPRTGADITRLAEQAGWLVSATAALGWGVECVELSPIRPR